MTLPNLLTVSRIPLLFIVIGLMHAEFIGSASLAFALFIVAALTDWLDGKLARSREEVSVFGRFMDSVIDKVLVIGLLIALVNRDYFLGYNAAATALLLCVLCREFAVSGLRMAAAVKGIIVEADAGGKLKTFTQFNAIGWLMGAHMLQRDFGHSLTAAGGGDWVLSVRVAGIALYVFSVILAVISGAAYFRRHGRCLLA